MDSSPKALEQAQFVGQQARDQEILSHMLLPWLTEFSSLLWVLQKLEDPIRSLLNAFHQESANTGWRLHRHSTHFAVNYRRAFPQSFRDY